MKSSNVRKLLTSTLFSLGFNGSLRVKTVDVYDPSTDIWSCATSMEARRSTLGKTLEMINFV